MLMKSCIPVLSLDNCWVREPRAFVAEVLHNYARSSSRQSGLFKVTSYSGDIATSDSEIKKTLAKIQADIEEYLKREFQNVNVTIKADQDKEDLTKYKPYVTVSWTFQGVDDKLEDIDLSLLASVNL